MSLITALDSSSDNKEEVINGNFRALQAGAIYGVISRTLTTPPTTPSKKGLYIPASPATGAWQHQENNLLYSTGNGWLVLIPVEGMKFNCQADNNFIRYSSGNWTVLTSTGTTTRFYDNLADLAALNAIANPVENDSALLSNGEFYKYTGSVWKLIFGASSGSSDSGDSGDSGDTGDTGTLWTPNDSSTIFWLDGSDNNSFTDKSANGLTPTNPSGGLPTYLSNQINGLSVINFNGSNQYLGFSGSIFASAADFTSFICIVVKPSATWASNLRILYWSGSPNSAGNFLQLGSTGSSNISLADHRPGNGNTVGSPGLVGFHIYTFDLVTGKSFTDGTETTVSGSTSTNQSSGGSNFTIGCYSGADLTAGFGQFSAIQIAQLYLGSGDRQKVEGYFAHLLNLTANLPATHPYKSSPPTI